MSTKMSTRRRREQAEASAAGREFRPKQEDRRRIPDTPANFPSDSWLDKEIRRNRAEFNRPAGGALLYTPRDAA